MNDDTLKSEKCFQKNPVEWSFTFSSKKIVFFCFSFYLKMVHLRCFDWVLNALL